MLSAAGALDGAAGAVGAVDGALPPAPAAAAGAAGEASAQVLSPPLVFIRLLTNLSISLLNGQLRSLPSTRRCRGSSGHEPHPSSGHEPQPSWADHAGIAY